MMKSFIYKSNYLKKNLRICFDDYVLYKLEFLPFHDDFSVPEYSFIKYWGKLLDDYFYQGSSLKINNLHLSGTSFQKDVWLTLLQIPLGHVLSYSALAKLAGHAHAVRAVASAVGKNPMPLFIPCHRVIRISGEIGKYSGGVDIKKKLILLESSSKTLL